MKQNISLTILFYFVFHFNVFAQQHNGFVTGKIVEDSTKLPLEFVTVEIINSNNSTIGSPTIAVSLFGFSSNSNWSPSLVVKVCVKDYEKQGNDASRIKRNR